MTKRPRTIWQRWFFGSEPSKELADVRSGLYGLRFANRLLQLRSADLAKSAAEIADVARLLRSEPGSR